jgi:AcrR family transcriptional regulator
MEDNCEFREDGRVERADAIDPVLLKAADLFDRHRYEGVRMHDVARAANISTRTLWRRYPNKSALVSAIVAAFSKEFALCLSALTEMKDEPKVRRMRDRVVDAPPWGREPDSPTANEIDPSLLLAAFVGFCEKHPALTRVALAFRDPIWGTCDRRADAALRAAIRHCIGARGASTFWHEQILCLFRFIAHDIRRPREGRPPSPWAQAVNEPDPYARKSPIGMCLRILISLAYKDSSPMP